MLLALLGAVAAAPVYWLLVPARLRSAVIAATSLGVLAIVDWRLLLLVVGVAALVVVTSRGIPRSGRIASRVLVGTALGVLALLFVLNKEVPNAGGLLPTQHGLVLVGLSYLVLKASAAMLDAARGEPSPASFPEVVGWLAFAPTYVSGPIEDLEPFRRQQPCWDRERGLAGLERILVGLVKALLAARWLAAWADPVIAQPDAHGRGVLLIALYAESLRVYMDFAGASDIAIGLAGLYGVTISENFDSPFLRRNLIQLWQRWHMTLTRWLRRYLFVPTSRALIRLGGPMMDVPAVVAAQVVTMLFCGLWHGLAWNFALWGLLQALGLVWVGVVARAVGSRMPAPLVAWWRHSTLALALSVGATFTAFSLSIIFFLADVPHGWHYLARLATGP
jgi:alginate O-acetyltransferase complex protein AlgI